VFPPAYIFVAYADTDANEIGTVYQSCNWIYCGKTSGTTMYRDATGKLRDSKLIHSATRSRRGRSARPDDVPALVGVRDPHERQTDVFQHVLEVVHDRSHVLVMVRVPVAEHPGDGVDDQQLDLRVVLYQELDYVDVLAQVDAALVHPVELLVEDLEAARIQEFDVLHPCARSQEARSHGVLDGILARVQQHLLRPVLVLAVGEVGTAGYAGSQLSISHFKYLVHFKVEDVD